MRHDAMHYRIVWNFQLLNDNLKFNKLEFECYIFLSWTVRIRKNIFRKMLIFLEISNNCILGLSVYLKIACDILMVFLQLYWEFLYFFFLSAWKVCYSLSPISVFRKLVCHHHSFSKHILALSKHKLMLRTTIICTQDGYYLCHSQTSINLSAPMLFALQIDFSKNYPAILNKTDNRKKQIAFQYSSQHRGK